MKIFITGMGGSGKSAVVEELSRRGNIGVDLDTTNLCFWVNKNTGKYAEYTKGSGREWLQDHSWRIDINGLKDLLETPSPLEDIYVAGKIAKSQIKELRSLFNKIFLLSPSDTVLCHRQNTRTNKENEFARSEDEQRHILAKRKDFETECLKVGAILIDADKLIKEVVDTIVNEVFVNSKTV